MDRRSVGVLLGTFAVLLILVVLTFFVDFGRRAWLVYILFALELGYLIWAATRKKTPMRKGIGIAILLFFPLLILVLATFFFDLGVLEKLIYLVFAVDFLFLFVLFLRKSIRNLISKREGKPVEAESFWERVTKWGVYAIPVVIFGYVAWINFNPFDEVIVYDIGGSDDEGVLGPSERVSGRMKEGSITYRNLTSSLVYFDVTIPFKAKLINIQVRFKDTLPSDSIVRIGARDKGTLEYLYNIVYDKRLENKTIYTPEDIPPLFPENSIIYIDPNLNITLDNEIKLNNYTHSELVIDNSIRGSHILFIYTEGDLKFEVWKRDLNLRDNLDELNISLYKGEDLIKAVIIPDDGNNHPNNIIPTQKGILTAKNLKEGVYKLELKNNEDMTINKIICDCSKLVFKNQIFVYGPAQLYTKAPRNINLKVKVIHKSGLQTITINKWNLGVNETNRFFDYSIDEGEYTINIPKGDMIVVSPYYFSFSKDSYFIPFNPIIVENPELANLVLKQEKEKAKKDNWITEDVEIDISNSYSSENNKQTFVLNFPIIDNAFISVDWIKLRIKK